MIKRIIVTYILLVCIPVLCFSKDDYIDFGIEGAYVRASG